MEIPELLINAQQASTILDVTKRTLKNWTKQGFVKNYGTKEAQYQLTEICELKSKKIKYIRFKDLNGVK